MKKLLLMPSLNMKRALLCFIFPFPFLLSPAFAQGTWSPRDTLPYDTNAMFQGIPGFSIGNYGYAGLSRSDELWQFSAVTNTWTKKASFPGSARVDPACFVIGDNAYLVCGAIRNGGTCVAECWQYSQTTNIWTQKANFPGSPRVYEVGFAIDSLGYVGVGSQNLTNFFKDFYSYHPSSDTWMRVADFGGIARDGASGFGVNGKGYVCFGEDSLFSSDWLNIDMWEYDPIANTWTQKSNYPGYPTYVTSGFAICNNIYVGSGFDSAGGASNTFWKYNTVSDSWSRGTNVPGPSRIQGDAFSIADTGYYGFGGALDTTSGIDVNIFDKFFAGDSCSVVTANTIVSDGTEIWIYPNPFKDKCNIIMPNLHRPLFRLYDVTGRSTEINILYSNPYYIIDRDNLSAGIYILTIISDRGRYYKKLIITN